MTNIFNFIKHINKLEQDIEKLQETLNTHYLHIGYTYDALLKTWYPFVYKDILENREKEIKLNFTNKQLNHSYSEWIDKKYIVWIYEEKRIAKEKKIIEKMQKKIKKQQWG